MEIDNENIADQLLNSYLVLFKFIAQADGVISADEIQYFEEFIIKATGDEDMSLEIFQNLHLYEDISLEETISALQDLTVKQQELAIINACGVSKADSICTEEEQRIINVCLKLDFDNSRIGLIGRITQMPGLISYFNEHKTDKNISRKYAETGIHEILVISDESHEADILLHNSNIKAIVFLLHSRLYFYGYSTNGRIINEDGRVFFDGMALEIKTGDSLILGEKRLGYEELFRRLHRKKDNYTKQLWINCIKQNDTIRVEITGTKTDHDCIGVSMSANTCSVKVEQGGLKAYLFDEELKPGNKVVIDFADSIMVRTNFTDVENISFTVNIAQLSGSESGNEKITLDISQNSVMRISNISMDADIFLESLRSTGTQDRIELEIRIDKGKTLFIKESYLPVLLNGKKTGSDHLTLHHDDVIQIEKEIIICDFVNGELTNDTVRIEKVEVKNIQFNYPGKKHGLQDVSFSNTYGDFTCIMGPSGCGKSTLMRLMLGYNTDYTGSIDFNGISFHENFTLLRDFVGYVPQDDLLYENLSVYENLYYAGRLKRPDLSKQQLNIKIEELLIELGLSEKRDLAVGNELKRTLSGGERRRLNIGLEMLSGVNVLFLDEPTSGLSSYDSKKVIDMLWNYSNKGNIVYVVIHQPAPELYFKFNKLILLDYGGNLAWFGDTREAINYFNEKSIRIDQGDVSAKSDSPDLLFNVMQEVRRDLDGNPLFKIDKSGKKIPLRVRSPETWKRLFENYRKQIQVEYTEDKEYVTPDSVNNTPLDRIVRFYTLFIRNFKDKLRDKMNILMTFLVPIVLVLILSFLMRGKSVPEYIDKSIFEQVSGMLVETDKKETLLSAYSLDKKNNRYIIRQDLESSEKDDIFDILTGHNMTVYLFKNNENFEKFLFLSVIMFIFLGITNSISEILKDRAKIQRERLINIKTFDYVFTKVITIMIFSAIQVFLYMILCFPILQIPFALPEFGYYGVPLLTAFYVLSFLTIGASVMLGFFISALIKSEKSIFTIIPVLIIPQILFGGIFLNFNEMGGRLLQRDRPVPFYNDLVFSRWAYEGLLISTYKYNPENTDIWKKITNDYVQKNPDKYEKISIVSKKYNQSLRNKYNDSAILTINSAKTKWNYLNHSKKIYHNDSVFKFIQHLLSSHDIFPARKKKVYNFKIDTIMFNSLVLLFFITILFCGLVILIQKERTINYKKRFRKSKERK